jgi:hypothetical protein
LVGLIRFPFHEMMQSSRPFEDGSSTGETECKPFHCNIDTAESPQTYTSDLLANIRQSVGQPLANRNPNIGHFEELTRLFIARRHY